MNENQINRKWSEFNTSYDKGNYNKALDALFFIVENTDEREDYIKGYINIALCYECLGDDIEIMDKNDNVIVTLRDERDELYQKAMDALDSASQFVDPEEDDYYLIFLRKASLFYFIPLSDQRRYLIKAMESKNPQIRQSARKKYISTTDFLISVLDEYKTLPSKNEIENEKDQETLNYYNETINSKFTLNSAYTNNRQFIFIVKDIDHISGCYDQDGNISWVFTIDQIPSDIEFPVGHPQANTLYIANPSINTQYIPYKDSEYQLFLNKIREYCYLLQCLGATEISFRSVRGKAVSENITSELNANIGFDSKYDVSCNYNSYNSHKQHSNNKNGIEITQTFIPNGKPYCPNDLKWLNLDKDWQLLVKQRLEGNLTSYKQKISSLEINHVSKNKISDIKLSFDSMMLKINAGFNKRTDSTFDYNEDTEWEINVKFNSNQTSSDCHKESLTKEEKEYKEEFLFCTENDNIIDNSVRRLLERKRQKLGLSVKRATEIENSCSNYNLTNEEKEYIDIFKDGLIDGTISKSFRRILEHNRNSLGISKERADELESINKKI